MKAILDNRFIQHCIFWCFYVIIYTGNYLTGNDYIVSVIPTLLLLPIHISFTYTQLYVLIPRFLLRRRIAAYVISSLLFTQFMYAVNQVYYSFVVYPLKTGESCPYFKWNLLWTINPGELRTIFSLFMICGLAISVKMLKKWYQESNRRQQIEKEKLSMELDMLKAQVHPHFLFNTLNNLYALTLVKSDRAPLAVSHLADMLRYILYECNERQVPLEKEITALKKYMELEKLRYGNRIELSFSCTGDTRRLNIAPLILLPFVENSFKHGVSEQIEQCWVNLNLHAEGDIFIFNLSNSRNEEPPKENTGGIGLQNIRKRLDLLYPGLYTLTVNEEHEMYAVKLQMKLAAIPVTTIAHVRIETSASPIPALA
ncbi:MAG: histidine kinase [Chitinophagaceae bacterium]